VLLLREKQCGWSASPTRRLEPARDLVQPGRRLLRLLRLLGDGLRHPLSENDAISWLRPAGVVPTVD
jgi:hypothetical protein